MAKYILCIILGLLLFTKFTSGYDDVEENKRTHTITRTECNLIAAAESRCEQGSSNNIYHNQSNVCNIVRSLSLRYTSPSPIHRFNLTNNFAGIGKTFRVFQIGEKIAGHTYYKHTLRDSYRYYVYTLRHILV